MEECIAKILSENGFIWSSEKDLLVVTGKTADYFNVNRERFQRMLERYSEKLGDDMFNLNVNHDVFHEMKKNGELDRKAPVVGVLTPMGVFKTCFLFDGVIQRTIKKQVREQDVITYLLVSSFFSEEFMNKKYQKELSFLIDSVFYEHKVEHEKTIGVFRVDCLIDDVIVVECDEPNHKYYNFDFEKKREQYLISKGYIILRYQTKDDNMLGFIGKISDCIAELSKKGA